MENAIEMEVKTKKWQQFIFEIAGVEEHVEEEHVERWRRSVLSEWECYFLSDLDIFCNEYLRNST